jgi:hypothetical protein
MYGNASSYEGCKFLHESFQNHSKFKDWYQRMKEKLETGYIEQIEIRKLVDDENSSINALSGDSDNSSTIIQTEPLNLVKQNEIIQSQTESSTVNTAAAAITETTSKKLGKPDNDSTLKILPAIYMIHVIAFTFAAYMSKHE